MSKTESAKAALERIRVAVNNRAPADPLDVDALISYFVQVESVVHEAVELLHELQIERARKMLEELR
jgi:hypothetical protein